MPASEAKEQNDVQRESDSEKKDEIGRKKRKEREEFNQGFASILEMERVSFLINLYVSIFVSLSFVARVSVYVSFGEPALSLLGAIKTEIEDILDESAKAQV